LQLNNNPASHTVKYIDDCGPVYAKVFFNFCDAFIFKPHKKVQMTANLKRYFKKKPFFLNTKIVLNLVHAYGYKTTPSINNTAFLPFYH